jgi:hypothetical protein
MAIVAVILISFLTEKILLDLTASPILIESPSAVGDRRS